MKTLHLPMIALCLATAAATAVAAFVPPALTESFATGQLGNAAHAMGIVPQEPRYGPNGIRIRLAPGTDAGPLVRALDSHFDCLEIIPDGITGQGDILQDCDGYPDPNEFRVHAH